jgi:ribosomal protein S3
LNSEKGVLKKTQISSIFGDLISINTKIKKNENSFNGALPDRNVNGILINYKTHVQNSISQHFGFNAKLVPFKVENEWQDAGYFADEIVYLLERRIGFNRLKNRILTQVATNPKIQGIRITCSGRVGGKSKKAQRAKMDSIKYGQTSLHVFSSKIDFAVRTAFTPLGSTGVKVWICYD